MATNPVKRSFTFTIKDFYREFRLMKKQTVKRVDKITPEKKYRGIIEGFFVGVMKKVIYENFSFFLPYSMGLQVVKGRPTNLKDARIDYHKSKKLKKVVKHLNKHTFGYYYYIDWMHSFNRFKNRNYYVFKVTKTKPATEAGVGRIALSNHITQSTKDKDMKSYTRI